MGTCYRKRTDMMELSLYISKVAIQFTSPPPPPGHAEGIYATQLPGWAIFSLVLGAGGEEIPLVG
jgi:hypothetical protein